MAKDKKRGSYLKEIAAWLFCFLISGVAAWFIFPQFKPALAAVTNNGVFFYGDTTNAGIMRGRTFTSPSTLGTEFNGITGSASNILWTVAKTAPTREEMMIGSLRVNGELQVETCTTGCDANADFTARWNNPGTTATQDCDSAPTSGTCVRAFDIGYESLSGQAFVAYADSAVAGKFYYARWDGSAWSPNSTPGTPGVSNEIDLPGLAATPKWIRVIPAGDNLADDRSNRVMVLMADIAGETCGGDCLYAFYWDGSSFDAGTTIDFLANVGLAQSFDGNWQGNNTFILSYLDDDGTNDVKYRKYTVGTGWGAETQAYTSSAAGQWVTSAADPTSSRILVTTSSESEDTRSAVWRGDDATDGWTVCAITDCPDTTTEIVSGMQGTTAFERFNGEGLHLYNNAGTTSTTQYSTYTPSATWGAVTSAGITTGDDLLMVRAWGSPNSDDILAMTEDVDCDTDARLWTGAAWSTLMATVEADNSSYGLACPNLTQPGTAPGGAAQSYSFAWKIYSPWQRNWRFYSGSDTADTPTTALAAENTTPTDFATSGSAFRLRANYAERALGATSSQERKKLQYTSGCNPNSVLETTCTWTDVDDAGGAGIWRYKASICGSCTDGTLLAGVVLTGTAGGTCTAGNNTGGVGTWVLDKDAATTTCMDHASGVIQESEWDVESNGAAGSTTYYFRIYNALIGTDGQDTPVYREQDADDCGAGSAQCTYPSLATAAASGPTTDDVMRHGNWFSGGVEQSFFWAD